MWKCYLGCDRLGCVDGMFVSDGVCANEVIISKWCENMSDISIFDN